MNEKNLVMLRNVRVYTRRHLKFDVVAAIVVFLIAIPLCLGVALASGAPIFSGIISGIIGGIIVGSLSGSQISVSGPDAALATVVFSAIAALGSFDTFLLALLLAGLIQVVMGMFRAGFLVEYVPGNVVQGLLCAIGILLVVKQIPLAFTFSSDFKSLQPLLVQTTEGLSLAPLYGLTYHINSGAALYTLISLAILIFFDKTKNERLKAFPATIAVLICCVLLNELFIKYNSIFAQANSHLVNVPQPEVISDFMKHFYSPDWSSWNNPNVYFFAVVLAVVASLSSLLNIKAAEKLDKRNPECSKDKELVAQGIGNILSSLVGGLVVTSVIIRTSVNIQSGAVSKVSTILHGVFILCAVVWLPQVLNMIPISCLAAILMYTGFKLTRPALYTTIYQQGANQFVPFIATVVSIVLFNLLGGMLIGLAISFFFILKSNSQARLDIIKEMYPNGTTYRLVLPQFNSFLNKVSFSAELNGIPHQSQVVIDARYAQFIDKEIIELLKDFQLNQAPKRKISLNLIGFKESYDIHNHINFINVTTYDVQSHLNPSAVLTVLKEGNERFLNNTPIHRSSKLDISLTAEAQHPMGVVLGCIDSRVPVETVFDMTFGDLFCARVAGNIINDDILASIEFACHVAGAKLIVVLGHTSCGAIKAACDHYQEGYITELLAKIKPSIERENSIISNRDSSNKEFLAKVTQLNIANTMYQIYEKSSILRHLIDTDRIAMVGASYQVEDGSVVFDDYATEIEDISQKKNYPLALKSTQFLAGTKSDN